jgi:hypothetical protein
LQAGLHDIGVSLSKRWAEIGEPFCGNDWSGWPATLCFDPVSLLVVASDVRLTLGDKRGLAI